MAEVREVDSLSLIIVNFVTVIGTLEQQDKQRVNENHSMAKKNI